MIETKIAHPPVVSTEEWRKARIALLAHEKELTHHKDRVNAERRRLPMVKVEKDYTFETTEGPKSLLDLFEGRRQLLIYHFMFDPEWDKGCPGCTGFVDALGDLSLLEERDTTFVLVSRAPLDKLLKYKAERGWDEKWVSSFGSDFNYDYNATADAKVKPIEYNYRTEKELEDLGMTYHIKGENPGLSTFFRIEDDVYYANSTYARGLESVTDSYALLDMTPYGRQEEFEDSPEGWPQKPTY
jgi:predicted dithiol-disulfide oxidoreductase (DUF899 family)